MASRTKVAAAEKEDGLEIAAILLIASFKLAPGASTVAANSFVNPNFLAGHAVEDFGPLAIGGKHEAT